MSHQSERPSHAERSGAARLTIVGALFFLSGASSLIFETLFTRLLSYTFGNTAYAASTVLAAFLGGLALGAYLIGRWVDRLRPSLLIYGGLELAIGLYGVLVPALFALLTRTYVSLFHAFSLGPLGSTVVRFVLATLVIIVPAALMGGTLPVLARIIAARSPDYQLDLVRFYALNTFGAATGTLASTYFLVPVLGVRGTIITAFLVNTAIFACTAWLEGFRLGPRRLPDLSAVKASSNFEEPAEAGALDALMLKDTGNAMSTEVLGLQDQDLQNKDSQNKDSLDRFRDKSNGKRSSASASSVKIESPVFLLIAAFFAGLLTLSYEVVWTHALAFLVGNAVYAFGMMLFTFLCGLAAGAHLLPRFAWDSQRWAWAFAISQALAGISVILTLPLWNRVPDLFALGLPRAFQLDLLALSLLVLLRLIYVAVNNVQKRWKEAGAEVIVLASLLSLMSLRMSGQAVYFVASEAFRFFIAFYLLIVPILFLGISFPALLNLFNQARAQAGKSVGSIYAANTVGCILGSLLAGFVFLPLFGSYATLGLAAILNLSLGAGFFQLMVPAPRVWKLGFLGVFAVILLIVGVQPLTWDIRNLTQGNYVYFQQAWKADKILFAREDVQGGLTTVIQSGGTRILLSNGKFQGNNTGEVQAQVRFVLIPALFTHELNRALVIGLGTGSSLRTLSAFPFRRIDVVELAPAVIEAARKWFPDVNGDVLDHDPRVHLTVADGRNHLLVSQDHYDLITIEVTSIWINGEADLYNKEFYELCRSHLTEQGILQQWVQVHHMRPKDFFTVLNTAAQVFPHVAFFLGPEQGLLLASSSPLAVDYSQINAFEHMPSVRHEMDLIGAHGMFSMLGEMVLYDQSYRALMSQSARANLLPENFTSTDMYPYLEYQTPKGNVVPADFLLNPGFFVQLRPPVLPPDLILQNLPDPDSRDYISGLALEDRGDFAGASNYFGRTKGRSRTCAQSEMAWIEAFQHRSPNSPLPSFSSCDIHN